MYCFAFVCVCERESERVPFHVSAIVCFCFHVYVWWNVLLNVASQDYCVFLKHTVDYVLINKKLALKATKIADRHLKEELTKVQIRKSRCCTVPWR